MHLLKERRLSADLLWFIEFDTSDPVPAYAARVRRLALSALLVGAALILAGCTVPVAGVSGIGVDANGHPVGYLMVCHDHINAAQLGHGQDVWDGSWDAIQPVTGFATFDLADPGSEWSVDRPLATLTPQDTYTFYGATSDNSWSTASIDFTLADLAQLEPGEVRYWSSRGSSGYVVGTAADFQAHACDEN